MELRVVALLSVRLSHSLSRLLSIHGRLVASIDNLIIRISLQILVPSLLPILPLFLLLTATQLQERVDLVCVIAVPARSIWVQPLQEHLLALLLGNPLIIQLIILLLLVPLLLLLRSHTRNGLVVQLLGLLVLLHIHEVDFLNLKVEVADPRVQVLHHGELHFVEFVDAGVDVSEEQRHLEEALVEAEVRVQQGEDAPADYVVARHDVRLKEDQLE